MTDIQSALDGATFDPSTSKRRFIIVIPGYATITLFPRLLSKLQKEAPNIILQAITPSMHYGEYLDTQRADIALLDWSDPPKRFDWVCVMRSDHPMVGKRPTLDRYSNVKHLLISPKGERCNWVDDALAEHGRTRHADIRTCTALILENTGFVLTCPASIGR